MPGIDDRHQYGPDRLSPAGGGNRAADAGKDVGGYAGVCGSQSSNAVNQLRVLGRWMRMITIPNQSFVAKAFFEFDSEGRMKG